MDNTACSKCVNKQKNLKSNYCFYYCNNEKAPKGYGRIITCCIIEKGKTPVWCPLKE